MSNDSWDCVNAYAKASMGAANSSPFHADKNRPTGHKRLRIQFADAGGPQFTRHAVAPFSDLRAADTDLRAANLHSHIFHANVEVVRWCSLVLTRVRFSRILHNQVQWSENVIKADPFLEGLGFDSACPPGFRTQWHVTTPPPGCLRHFAF